MQIYLSSWSLKETILRGKLSVEDLPEFAVRHDFSGIELMDGQIQTFDPQYLEDLKRKCQNAGCGVILDVSSDLTYLDDEDSLDQIVYVQNMLDAAKQLGSGKVRIWLGGQSMSFQRLFKSFNLVDSNEATGQNIRQAVIKFIQKLLVNKFTIKLAKNYRKSGNPRVKDESLKIERAVQALKNILPKAEQYEIPLAIENHWGISSLPENILKIVNEFGSPYIGTCPDFGNFPEEADPYKGLQMLASKAIHVHAKSLNFDAKGEECNIDYKRCLQILKDSSYADTITVEYEGRKDPVEGCLRTKELILRHW
jgi:sugar phosphate isomerase/epimerase